MDTTIAATSKEEQLRQKIDRLDCADFQARQSIEQEIEQIEDSLLQAQLLRMLLSHCAPLPLTDTAVPQEAKASVSYEPQVKSAATSEPCLSACTSSPTANTAVLHSSTQSSQKTDAFCKNSNPSSLGWKGYSAAALIIVSFLCLLLQGWLTVNKNYASSFSMASDFLGIFSDGMDDSTREIYTCMQDGKLTLLEMSELLITVAQLDSTYAASATAGNLLAVFLTIAFFLCGVALYAIYTRKGKAALVVLTSFYGLGALIFSAVWSDSQIFGNIVQISYAVMVPALCAAGATALWHMYRAEIILPSLPWQQASPSTSVQVPAAAGQPASTKAIIGLVAGSVGLLFTCCGQVFLGLLGAGTGLGMSLHVRKKENEKTRFTMAGLTISAIALGLCLVLLCSLAYIMGMMFS